jgi:hypothetical protein
MPKRTDISSILIIGAGPIIIGQACEFDYSGNQAVRRSKDLSVSRRSIRNHQHCVWQQSCYATMPAPQSGHREVSFPAFPISAAQSERQRYVQLSIRKRQAFRHRRSLYQPTSVLDQRAWQRLSDFRSPLLSRRSQSLIAKCAQRYFRPMCRLPHFVPDGSARSIHWYPAISQFWKLEIFTFTRWNILSDVCTIGCFDKVLDKFLRRHGPDFCGPVINGCCVRPFEQRTQFSFQRSAVRSCRQAGIAFDRIVNIPDGNSAHHQSPMIAMQSMYAMKSK